MKNQGIDWSLGTANVNKETGIHYGVIPQGNILQAWTDSSEAVYPEITEFEPDDPCANCEYFYVAHGQADSGACDNFALDMSDVEQEPSEFILEDSEYTMTQSADDTDIFVLQSPYYTYAPYCSPCAPGACYLPDAITMQTDEIESFARVYCVDKTWFEDKKCPYIYWNVKTGKVEYQPTTEETTREDSEGQALLEFVFIAAFIVILLYFALPWAGMRLF